MDTTTSYSTLNPFDLEEDWRSRIPRVPGSRLVHKLVKCNELAGFLGETQSHRLSHPQIWSHTSSTSPFHLYVHVSRVILKRLHERIHEEFP
ncbi:hypothetical protein AB6A40_004897 [Gnathostoma spinigerum]|uniref:Uncharacterized protein n=1 Tax=Gnathostoma spinigerum TaxID=75299 RepID=A0ABD6EDV6_9BILA